MSLCVSWCGKSVRQVCAWLRGDGERKRAFARTRRKSVTATELVSDIVLLCGKLLGCSLQINLCPC